MRARLQSTALWVLVTLVALVLGAGPARASEPEAARDLEELRDRIARIVNGELQGSVNVAIVEHGQVAWAGAFGKADIERDVHADVRTQYRVGSLSKSFIAFAILRLVEDGRLGLDDRVRDVVPEIELDNPWADTDPVRVAQLLEHTTGFDEMRPNELVASDTDRDLSLREVLAINPRSRRVRWRPGTRHGYSHPGYTTAGYIVEQVSGQRYDEYLRKQIFEPLGLEHASFRLTPEVEGRLARGYSSPGAQPVPHVHLHHRPGSNLYISAYEMAEVVAMLVRRGHVGDRQLLQAASIERMEAGGTLPYGDLTPSYGLGNYRIQMAGVLAQAHGGFMPGYGSMFAYMPEQGSGFVLLTNEVNAWFPLMAIHREVQDYLLRDVEPREPREVELPVEQLEAFAGSYRLANPQAAILEPFARLGNGRSVYVSGGKLWVRGPGPMLMELVPTGPNDFRQTCDTDASVRFTTDPDGQPIMIDASHFGYYERESAWVAWGIQIWAWVATWLLLSAALAPLLWVPLVLIGRRSEVAGVGLRLWPSLGSIAFLAMIRILFTTPIHQLGTVNGRTIAIFWLSWAFALLAVVSVVHAVRSVRREEPSGLVRWHALLVSIALVSATAFFGSYGYVGLRMWLW